MSDKFFISISGKSAVGKSDFSNLLAQKINARVFAFDKISHLSLCDSEIKRQLREKFCNQIFDSSDNIDRKKLGAIVFNDNEKLSFLNNICQIFMENYIDNAIFNTNENYIIFDYALLPKMKYFEMSNLKILIEADEKVRFDRLIRRDNVSESYLKARDKNLPNYDKNLFDYVFENSDLNKDNLSKQVDKICSLIKKIQTSITL